MKWRGYIGLILMVLLGCAEPIDFQIEGTELIVVDGRISTEVGDTYISIYSPSSSTEQRQGLKNYNVRLISGNGVETIFTESPLDGRYIPEASFQGEVAQKYRLQSVSPDGYVIVSEYDQIAQPAEFVMEVRDNIEQQLVKEELRDINVKEVFVTLGSADDSIQSKFTFKYQYIHYWTRETISVNVVDEFALFDCSNVCQDENELLVTKVNDRDWYFHNPACGPRPIPECPDACCLRASDWETEFIVSQETMTSKTYRFWKNVEKLIGNDGLIFDTFPFEIKGNVSCNECDVQVVGNISAVSMTTKKSNIFL